MELQLGTLVVISLFAGWVETQSSSTCPADQPITEVCLASQNIVPAMNQFAVNLYSQVRSLSTTAVTTNLVVLPIHAATGLLMSCNAARDQTHDEIVAGLHLPAEVSCMSAAGTILDLYRTTPHQDTDTQNLNDVVFQVNRAFVDKSVKLKEDFLHTLSDRFNQTPGIVDFKNSEKAAADINKWVANRTNGNIQNLLSGTDISPNTQLMIVNSHFLQFFWLMQFDRSLTKKGTFNNADGTASSVDMMTFRGPQTIFYMDNLKASLGNLAPFHLVKLYSKWLNGEMLIFLPKYVDALAALEKVLTAEMINQIATGAKRTSVQVTMPKFSIETRVDLKDALKGLGIQALFAKDADLTAMTDSPVNVSSFVHKAMIKVKEEGLQAAAGTVLSTSVRGAGMPLSSPVQFVVDRPFMWTIRLTQTNFITYLGRVVKL